MQSYEYKVVPAPARGQKARGLKTTGERFANALSVLMNELARDGWEYQRADTLPCDERSGLTGRSTTFQHMLIFRRATGLVAGSVGTVSAIHAGAEAEAPRLSVPGASAVAPVISSTAEGQAPRIGPATSGAKATGAGSMAAE